jgi:type II secretory pathway pseudopilin PulG
MVCTSNTFKITNMRDIPTKRFGSFSILLTIVIAAIGTSLLFSFSADLEKSIQKTNYHAYAQAEQQEQQQQNNDNKAAQRITINLDSVKFAPLTNTNSNANQLKVDIFYKTNDPKLVNTIMAGVMKVYLPDGTLIKTSTIQDDYILGQAGPMQFATSFEDKTINNVKAEITMTDHSHTETFSNTLTVPASLEK